jgi:serine/threonine protein kinase
VIIYSGTHFNKEPVTSTMSNGTTTLPSIWETQAVVYEDCYLDCSTRDLQDKDHEESEIEEVASSTSSFHGLASEQIAEQCGWQQGEEKYLWNNSMPAGRSFEVVGSLGSGSLGEVDEVQMQTRNSSPFIPTTMARKRIRISRWKDKANRETWIVRNEVENMKTLIHPNIVRVLGCYEERIASRGHSVYVLMYPVGDQHLGDFLQYICPGNPHKTAWIRNWFSCLASALAHMHLHNIHHEDIKPSNIIHRNDQIFFADFGSSRKLKAGQATSTESPASATKMFAAPEAMISDEGVVLRHGSKTDVFSLGLVFLEMFIVMHGREIISFRKHLFRSDQWEYGHYHQVTERIPTVLNDTCLRSSFYKECIVPMLLTERQDRPSATQVLNVLHRLEQSQEIFPDGDFHISNELLFVNNPILECAADDKHFSKHKKLSHLESCSLDETIQSLLMVHDAINVFHTVRSQYDDEWLIDQGHSVGLTVDKVFIANYENLLLCLQAKLIHILTQKVVEATTKNCGNKRNRKLLSWFTEFPNYQHPSNKTGGRLIEPSLAVLWGVCWIYYNTASQQYTKENNHVPLVQLLQNQESPSSAATQPDERELFLIRIAPSILIGRSVFKGA